MLLYKSKFLLIDICSYIISEPFAMYVLYSHCCMLGFSTEV